MAHKIMLVGTASSVGKSTLCAGLCRIFAEDGFGPAPFKAQNMSLNSGVTPAGLEMGRAQILQAEASGVVPDVRMNPILLKPVSEVGSQVVLLGKVYGMVNSQNYLSLKKELKSTVLISFQSLENQYETIVIEGAGSAAEINLNENDIVNMGLAEMVDAPVLLVADIDKGGVFASIYGTVMLLKPEERKRIKGILINKFRGSVELLAPGIHEIERLVGIRVLGVVPYMAHNLPEEDSLMEEKTRISEDEDCLNVGIVMLPHLSNYTDFQALANFKDVSLHKLGLRDEVDSMDLILIPGSKNTMEDLKLLREQGTLQRILNAHRKGAFIGGICGGYQMMGESVEDPYGVESENLFAEGLGLIPMKTGLNTDKQTVLVEGTCETLGSFIKGYEIHMGQSRLHGSAHSLFQIVEGSSRRDEGYADWNQRIFGTYLHGVFDNSLFTRNLLNKVRTAKGLRERKYTEVDAWEMKEKELSALAKMLRENVDIEAIYEVLHG